MKKRYVRQGGSALVYALVAVVLVVVLAGGLYWARQYESPTEVAKNDGSSTSKQEKTPVKEPAGQSADRKSNDKVPAAPSAIDQKRQQGTTASPQSNGQELPVTGPTSSVGQVVAVMALAFGAASYITSRRTRWTSREK